ncbi:MAG TPA: head GIN domain-containing protein [Bacteroidia bacterium]|jgi:hypothetical protein
MKNLTFLSALCLFASALFLVSCDDMNLTTGDGSEKVVANGKLAVIEVQPGAFNQVKLNGVFNVFLIQGEKESVKMEADENVLPFILTSVDNAVLTVKMKNDIAINKMKKINVYITFVNLSKVSTEGVGMLNCADRMTFKEIELDCKGVGATRLDLVAEKLTIHSEIVGAMFLKGLVTEVVIDHKGVGAIRAFELKAEKLTLNSEGIGTAEVYASKELNIHSSGFGGVQYKGDPATKNINTEGLGKVARVD